MYRHREFLGNLGGRETAHALQHLVTVLSLGLQFLDVACQILDLFLLRHIGTRLAYLRQHLGSHPALESLRLLQLRRENQCIETALVDDGHCLGSTKGALNQGVLFIFCIYVCSQGISALGIPQCLCDVLTHEEGLTPLVRHRPDFSEHLVIENLNL